VTVSRPRLFTIRRVTGIAWSWSAVAAILGNPRYTGRHVWNRQRKDEVPIDVSDVALGHITKMRWNEPGTWIWSEWTAHEPLIDTAIFEQTQLLRQTRSGASSAGLAGPRVRTRCAGCCTAVSVNGGCRAAGTTTPRSDARLRGEIVRRSREYPTTHRPNPSGSMATAGVCQWHGEAAAQSAHGTSLRRDECDWSRASHPPRRGAPGRHSAGDGRQRRSAADWKSIHPQL
jgi:hypothetical protein